MEYGFVGSRPQNAGSSASVRPAPRLTSGDSEMNGNGTIRRTAVPSQRGAALRLPPTTGSPDPGDLKAVRIGQQRQRALALSTCSAVLAASR